MKKVILPLLAFAFVLPACVGKTYKRPTIELPQYSQEQIQQDAQKERIQPFKEQKWWHIFNDETLNGLEEDALKYNHDFKSALSRVLQAKAKLSVDRSGYYPKIDFVAQFADSTAIREYKKSDVYSDRMTTGLSISYELDLWGKYYRQSQSAKADYQYSKTEKDAIMLTLTGEVAKTYFSLIALDAQLKIAKATLDIREESFRVYSSRFNKGVINELDLRRVEAEMESVRAQYYSVENSVKLTESALVILVGKSPNDIVTKNIDRTTDVDSILNAEYPNIPEDVPSDLIARRPDIKAAEYMLESANAQVGAAKALLFPSISLTGFGGVASHELEDLFGKDESRTWNYSADLVFPIFYGGQKRGSYKMTKEAYNQMLESYQKTIQNAFKETLDAININKSNINIIKAYRNQVTALETSYKLAVKREKAGLTSLLDVLDVQRTLLQSQFDLVNCQNTTLASIVDICKALGGGWSEDRPFDTEK